MPSLADIPGLGGYVQGQQVDQQQQLGQLQQLGILQGIAAKQRQARLEQSFRSEISQAKTPDEQLSVASKYMGPDALGKMVQSSKDRQAQIAMTHEAAMSRIQQAATNFSQTMQLRWTQAGTAQEKAAIEAQYKQGMLNFHAAAQNQAGQKLLYDTGIASPTVSAPQIGVPGGSATTQQQQWGPMAAGTPPEVAQAAGQIRQNLAQGGPGGNIDLGVLPQQAQQPNAPAAPVAAPSAPAAPNNLDARDLGAGARGPVLPTPTPSPAAPVSPVAAPTQAGIPQMPPEVARMPKKFQDAWTLDQAKKGTAGNTASENIVDLIGQGKMAVPSSFALRSPYWIDALERVGKKYPEFDASVYQARQSARRTFASGPEAKNVTSMNTLIGHLGTMADMADKLQNNDYPAANAVINRMKQELGDPTIVNFNTAKSAVAEETMRVFRQVGASDMEAKRWGDLLSSSGSPAQLHGNIATVGTLLDSRIKAIADQFERTVNQGGSNPARVMPQNREALDKMISGQKTNPNGWSIRPK